MIFNKVKNLLHQREAHTHTHTTKLVCLASLESKEEGLLNNFSLTGDTKQSKVVRDVEARGGSILVCAVEKEAGSANFTD